MTKITQPSSLTSSLTRPGDTFVPGIVLQCRHKEDLKSPPRMKEQQQMSEIKTMTQADLDTARGGSWYTIIGAGGSLEEWVEGYTEAMKKEEIGTPEQWWQTTGDVLNMYLRPTDLRDRFPDDLVVLMFPLDGLKVGKLAIFKIMMGDRWFDDVVSNTRSRTVWL